MLTTLSVMLTLRPHDTWHDIKVWAFLTILDIAANVSLISHPSCSCGLIIFDFFNQMFLFLYCFQIETNYSNVTIYIAQALTDGDNLEACIQNELNAALASPYRPNSKWKGDSFQG